MKNFLVTFILFLFFSTMATLFFTWDHSVVSAWFPSSIELEFIMLLTMNFAQSKKINWKSKEEQEEGKSMNQAVRKEKKKQMKGKINIHK